MTQYAFAAVEQELGRGAVPLSPPAAEDEPVEGRSVGGAEHADAGTVVRRILGRDDVPTLISTTEKGDAPKCILPVGESDVLVDLDLVFVDPALGGHRGGCMAPELSELSNRLLRAFRHDQLGEEVAFVADSNRFEAGYDA